MLERKRKVGLIRKYFINCSVDLSRCLKSLHQPIQNKIHHISIKGHPFPQIPAVTAHSAAAHFPGSSRLGTFILESSPSHPHQLQLLISLKASLDRFLSLHPLLPFNFRLRIQFSHHLCVPLRIHSSDTPHLLWPFFSKTTKVPVSVSSTLHAPEEFTRERTSYVA